MKNRIVFIIAVGRSGTKWLANMLQDIPDVICLHEPKETVNTDIQMYMNSYDNQYMPPEIFKRKKQFINRQLKDNNKIYIEVNGYLRLSIKTLKEYFPNALFIQLVRDGRKVVRSMMSKKKSILDRIHRVSELYTKFETACDVWEENFYIDDEVSLRVKIEDLVTNYQTYKGLLNLIGIYQHKRKWKNLRDKRINHTNRYTFPEYADWNKTQKHIFAKHCIHRMEDYGYQ